VAKIKNVLLGCGDMRTQVHTNNLEKHSPEGGDSMFLQNTATCLQVCVVSQHMRKKCQMCRVLKSKVPRRTSGYNRKW
jgi:hypothetical protein